MYNQNQGKQGAENIKDTFCIMQDSNKIPALDGLRALAVLLVFFRHVAHSFSVLSQTDQADFPLQPLWNIFFNGWIGVDLFYVLSGYLITRSLLHAPKHHWKIYAQKRILRIVPAYYAVLALCVLGVFPFYDVSTQDLGWRVFYHVAFLQDYFPADINAVFWSLGVEEKFYIIAPFLLLLFCGRQRQINPRRIGLILGGLLLTGYCLRYMSYAAATPETYKAFFDAARSPFHVNWETLLLGMAIAFWRFGKEGKEQRKAALVFWAAFAALTIFMATENMMYDISLRDVIFQPVVIALSMGALVWAAVAGYSNRLLDNPFTSYISRISYSFYLVHFPLSRISYYLWWHIEGQSVVFYTILYFFISFAAAVLCHQIFEKPFLKMKSRLDQTPA